MLFRSQLIAGVAVDPVTRQPITDGSVSVQLQACQDPSYDLCMGTVGLFTVDANGRFAHGARLALTHPNELPECTAEPSLHCVIERLPTPIIILRPLLLQSRHGLCRNFGIRRRHNHARQT